MGGHVAIQRRVYVISDLHLGGEYGKTGDPDDRGFRMCTHVDAAAAFVDDLASFPPGPIRIELVINGDVVDFLAEDRGDAMTWTGFIADADQAAATFTSIARRDRAFFDALGRFLARGHRLVVLLGNHDVELALPSVRRAFETAIGTTNAPNLEFIDGAEAYTVGDALIEHGNRYDEWNVVDHAGLVRVRAFQSRRQAVPPDRAFEISAGCEMVGSVINPVKAKYKFVDLLKPEIDAVMPMLLAVAPESRSHLSAIAKRRQHAGRHRLLGATLPAAQDIATAGDVEDPLRSVLAGPLQGDVDRFLTGLGGTTPGLTMDLDVDGDIASWRERGRQAIGLTRLALSRGGDEGFVGRLSALLMALRVLRTDQTFNRRIEAATEYERASRDLAQHGIKYVIFGHTHLARDVDLGGGCRYFNSGTWADLLEVPREVVSAPEAVALEALRGFAADLAANRLRNHVRFCPTYVRLLVDETGLVAEAALRDYVAGEEPGHIR
jgi:UDP-2,3-diacylglucosamine pyrophosphatase LpxH